LERLQAHFLGVRRLAFGALAASLLSGLLSRMGCNKEGDKNKTSYVRHGHSFTLGIRNSTLAEGFPYYKLDL